MEGTSTCETCGSSEFFLENGKYFCSTCQLQQIGKSYLVAKPTYENDHEINICLDKKDIPLWNSFQAYNIIIIAWCKEIMPLCKAPEEFRKTLLAVWASYLRESEAAFIENSSTPKLSLHPKWRDLQIFEHNKKSVSAGRYKIHKPENVQIIRKGKLVFQINDVENEDNIDNFAELHKILSSKRKFRSQISTELRQDFSDDSSNCSFTENQDETIKCLSMRGRKIINEIGTSNIKKANNLKSYFITDITLLKVFCILVLTLRLINENIFPSDFINWIKQGQFSFFSAARHLPPKWLLLTQDISSFTSRIVPLARSIRIYIRQIKDLLKIDQLPSPKLRHIIARYIKDLNLPSSFVNFIMINYPLSFFPNIQRSLENSCLDVLFPIELVAVCLILFTLKRHFCLDGEIEKRISYLAEKEGKGTFIWRDWQRQTFFWWKQISLHFLPTNISFEERALDSKVISNFFNQCAQEWSLPTNSTIGYTGPGDVDSFRQELRNNLFSIGNQKDDQFLSMPDLSIYHFTNAKNFVRQRLKTSGLLLFDMEDMEEDFSSKSIDFLSHEKYKVPFWPIKAGLKNIKHIEQTEARKTLEKRWPTPFRTLFNIICFLTGSNALDLMRIFFSLEIPFKKHDLEVTEFPIKIKSQQVNSSSSFESEEDGYQIYLEILNKNKHYVKQHKIRKRCSLIHTNIDKEEDTEIQVLKKNSCRQKCRSKKECQEFSNKSKDKSEKIITEVSKKNHKVLSGKTVIQVLRESKGKRKKTNKPIKVSNKIKNSKPRGRPPKASNRLKETNDLTISKHPK